MLLGEHKQKMDAKGRVVVPFKFRDEFGSLVIASKSLDEECLVAFSKEEFEKVAEKLDNQPMTNRKVRAFNRFFLAGANHLGVDKLGRVSLPEPLRRYAHLESEVVWIGVGNHVEIWNIDMWNKENAKFADENLEDSIDKDELLDYMAELGI